MHQIKMNSEYDDCEIALLLGEDDIAETIASMFPDQIVPILKERLGMDGECVAAAELAEVPVAIGAVDRDGNIRLWLKDATFADSPAISLLQNALEYFHSMRAKA